MNRKRMIWYAENVIDHAEFDKRSFDQVRNIQLINLFLTGPNIKSN